MVQNSLQNHKAHATFIERIALHQEKILQWLESKEVANELPLYSSVDIRDAGFKLSVVDTNLFPAGFNNLCEHGLEDSVGFIRNAINDRVKNCRDILIIAEEHTRNTWYLENVRILEEIIRNAGYNVKIATFLTVEPAFCEHINYVELKTATDQTVRIYCFKSILERFQAGQENFDLIIMNNDLTQGIPEILHDSKIPIYPSLQAGWHSRQKSTHFCHALDLLREFAKIVDMDPWLFSAHHTVIDGVDINNEVDRKRLMTAAEGLFEKIRQKYAEHKIKEKPFIFLKSDSGTYGMGVVPIEDPKDILELNRRKRNNLSVGKSAQTIRRFLLQEGVPTIYNIDQQVSEVCIYQIENNLIGGFYRSNSEKNQRDNLNSKGMGFKTMCPHLKKYGDCGVHHDVNIFDVYRIMARIAGIAAHREIISLEAKTK